MSNYTSAGLTLAREFLGKQVDLAFNQPVGSSYAPHGIESYPINYGDVPGVKAPDGDDLDAYLLNIQKPLDSYEGGLVIAIVFRKDDQDDPKLVVVPPNTPKMTDEEIMKQVQFQEHLYDSILIRG